MPTRKKNKPLYNQKKQNLKLGIINLGCPKNLVDTECMISGLDNYEITRSPSEADVILINTCAFLKEAREESEKAISDMLAYKKKNKDLKVIVAGCYVAKEKDYLSKKFPQVYSWIGVNDIKNINKALNEKGTYDKSRPFIYSCGDRKMLLNPYSAYVKIADGCNHRCSFCTIPAIKGRYRSRKIEDIVREIDALTRSGIKEINLISQDLTFYGKDLYGRKKIGALLSVILNRVKPKFWLRLLYLYPDFEAIKQIIGVMKNDKKHVICRYLDIPFQHVNDFILKSMKRGYRKKDILKILDYAEKNVPGITIRSSFITGYPGEDRKKFDELLSIIKEGRIKKAGFFAYSDEPGTTAYKLKGKISGKESEKRKKGLLLASKKVYYYNNIKEKGKIKAVLVIGSAGKNLFIARDEINAPDIDSHVIIKSIEKLQIGGFYRAKINGFKGYDLIGEAL